MWASVAAAPGLSSCDAQAQLPCGTWDSPRPGIEPVSPALASRLSTTEPPGKPFVDDLFQLRWKIKSQSVFGPIPSIITSSSINHIYDFITYFNFFSYIVQQQFLDLARGSTFPFFICVKTSLFPLKAVLFSCLPFLNFCSYT